jgi:eukaryotic-like serine/threonine-protein kinase
VPAAALKKTGQTGAKLGKYTLGDLLGKGGYADVYAASAKDGPDVAVKILDATAARDDDTVSRFKREADTAKRLEHANIVRVVDVGSSRSRHYIVMELMRGGSLRRLLHRGAKPDRVLAILTDVARALTYAHEKGVVHRDLKPENVLLTRSGRAKIADFGLARAVDSTTFTTEGRLLGTAVYMSPEQAKGQRATEASDVYSFGVMIYEAVTGKVPFSGDSKLAFLYMHAEVEPERPVVQPPFPAHLGKLALDCLDKDPAKRPTMAQVADVLASTKLVRFAKLRRALLIAGLVLAAFAVLSVIVPSVLAPVPALRRGAQAAHDAIFGN